jgi:branched-chain amino acid transport system substrate-binding protein
MAGFRHGFLPVAAGVLLAVGVAACSSSSSSTSSAGTSDNVAAGGGQCSNIPAGPIKLANIIPLSGPTAQGGQLAEIESNLEVAYFNAHDSVCGHQFVVTNYNDKGDPATSLGIARQIVGQGNTIIMEDSLSSAQNQDLPSNAQYAQLMVNWAKSHGDNNIGILSDGTSFSEELATDAQADVKAAGLTFVKTISYSPTAIDLTTPLTAAKEAGIQTLFPTGFTGLPAMIAGLKQIGWAPKIVGWGGLNDFGITASQVPPGTVDGCVLSYAPGQPTSALLTPENTDLLKESEAKIGLNPETSGILTGYMYLLAVKHAIETANSLDGMKLAAALSATSSLPTEVPGLALGWTATPSVHNGFPSSGLKECELKQGPYDILYAAS